MSSAPSLIAAKTSKYVAETRRISGLTNTTEETYYPVIRRNLSTTLRHRRFLFTDSFLLLWKWRVG